jgi:hypothetical protein
VSYADSLLASGERIILVAHQHWFILIRRAIWAIVALVAFVLIGGFALLNSSNSGLIWTLLGWAALALLVYGIVAFAYSAINFRSQEFVITSRRIIHASGVITKKAADSSLEKINDAVLTETLFGRMFGYGDLEVLTASESGVEKLEMLRDAKGFKKAMLEAKHELEIELTRPSMPALRTTDATTVEPAPAPAPAGVPAPAWGGAPTPAMAAGAAAGAATADDAPMVPPAAAPSTGDQAPTTHVDNTNEVANALERLGQLRDQGVITPEEFEAKKADLLSRL